MAIYVGILRDTVNVYDDNANGDAVPIRSIHGPSTGLDGVADIALDSLENLYVANAASSIITVYAPTADGDAAPIRSIGGGSTGLGVPASLAIDSTGNLYVLNTGGIFRPIEVLLFTAPVQAATSRLSAPLLGFRSVTVI